jgi:hypothetical protein
MNLKFIFKEIKLKSIDLQWNTLGCNLATPGKDFTPWVYALYRVNKRVLTRKIGQFRVTLRDITPKPKATRNYAIAI